MYMFISSEIHTIYGTISVFVLLLFENKILVKITILELDMLISAVVFVCSVFILKL